MQTKVQYVTGGGANTHEATYEYDGDGHVTKVTDWLASGGNSRLYGYDNAGRLTKITEPDLANLTYSYNALGQVTSINDYQSKVTSYTYTASGRLSTITAPDSPYAKFANQL